MNIRQEYNKEDLQTDIDWLIGQGVDESEAEPFIMRLLNKQWTEEFKCECNDCEEARELLKSHEEDNEDEN